MDQALMEKYTQHPLSSQATILASFWQLIWELLTHMTSLQVQLALEELYVSNSKTYINWYQFILGFYYFVKNKLF